MRDQKEEEEENSTENGEDSQENNGESTGEGNSVIEIVDEKGNPVNRETIDEEYTPVEIKIDKETGYAIDPRTGELLDPETGQPVNHNSSDLPDAGIRPKVTIEGD